ncbi:MAG: CpsD/CapB family tyrosine-protein kinase [Burkholderiaceae bacterium]|nr:CpsD/CapB family tyrosine-protein kinase [Burkholderiaceae bacterium]MEB2350085.1 CpsD/CapB family tyrosine-protein kinase [Burkholderiaceae bacterium]
MDPLSRAFYNLAMRLTEALGSRGLRGATQGTGGAVLVTSARAGEGKSLVTRAVASTSARTDGRKVLLVDANVRRPSLNGVCGIPGGAIGFADCLAMGRPDQMLLYRSNVPCLDMMAVGQSARPDLLFQTGAFRQFLHFYRQVYDLVLLDADTLDATGCLPHLVDGVLLVVDASNTRREVVGGMIEHAGIERSRFLGAVLNKREHHIPGLVYRLF